MKALVDWMLARRYRLIVLAVVFAPLLPPVSTALLATETGRHGVRQGLLSALVGVLGVALLAIVTSSGVALAGLALVSMLAGVGIGALINWGGLLGLAFQGTVLGCVVAVLAVTLFGPDSSVLVDPVIEQLVAMFRANGAPDDQLEIVRGLDSILLGFLVAGVFAQLIAALLLAYWWLTIARGQAGFGVEFRALKLGRVLGIPAMIIIALGLILDTQLVQNLAPMALCSVLLQGLAVMHAWAYAKNWHFALIMSVYLLMLTPLAALALLGLGAVGILDNLFDMRASLRAQD